MAYLDAYAKLVEEVQKNTPDAKADNVAQSVTMAKAGRMYEKADNKSTVVRELDAGTMLYPTGEKDGIWWKVSDELGKEGWVPLPLFALAKWAGPGGGAPATEVIQDRRARHARPEWRACRRPSPPVTGRRCGAAGDGGRNCSGHAASHPGRGRGHPFVAHASSYT
jgi:hypothetical protein